MPIEVDANNLIHKLAELNEKVQQRVVNKALRASGQLMSDAVEAETPVEVKWPGGTALLPDSIKPAWRATVGRGDNGYPQATIKPRKGTAHVARWVEYGHRLVRGGRSSLNKKRTGYTGPGKQLADIPPDPFIRPTFEATAQAAIAKFREVFYSELKRRS